MGLIEINTNAGGAMLNAVLARAHRACCAAMGSVVPTLASVVTFENRIVEMFRHEWRLSGRSRPLASIAIVDEAPEQQYLYPEFLLFQQLFERHGLRAVIADPASLEWRDGMLWHGDLAIDLVYNRLTDFYLEKAGSSTLHEAYCTPRRGADTEPAGPRAVCRQAPPRAVQRCRADCRRWACPKPRNRFSWSTCPAPRWSMPPMRSAFGTRAVACFFKPVAGFGSRAAYRGDKLTRRVWQEILAGDYVAQAIVAPGQRLLGEHDAAKAMKFDLRAYAYDGAVQWVAARLYQGQTTNFRTPGGGFAPVYSTVDASGRTLQACGDECSADGGHASYVFLLDEGGGVHAVPHALYVALARGEASAAALAGQTLRLADWYVRLKDGEPDTVVNETYSLVRFDAQGLSIGPRHRLRIPTAPMLRPCPKTRPGPPSPNVSACRRCCSAARITRPVVAGRVGSEHTIALIEHAAKTGVCRPTKARCLASPCVGAQTTECGAA